MLIRFSAAIAAMTLLSSPALAEGIKLADPQIAHIAYTAGVIDVAAGKQALIGTYKATLFINHDKKQSDKLNCSLHSTTEVWRLVVAPRQD